MADAQAVTPRQVEHDAALGCAVAMVSSVAFVVFVALPVRVQTLDVPVALEGIWQVGFLVGAFLGPVAAGLAAYASATAPRVRGAGVTRRARLLHWLTIALTAVLLAAYVANASALRGWLD